MIAKIIDGVSRFCSRVVFAIGTPFLILVFLLMFLAPLGFFVSMYFNIQMIEQSQ